MSKARKGMKHTDQRRGLYKKYVVTRTDGSSGRGRKHEHCVYFTLDLVHDPFAGAALRAYAKACKEEYPELAADLRALDLGHPCPRCDGVGRLRCGCRSAGECTHPEGVPCYACRGWGVRRVEGKREEKQ